MLPFPFELVIVSRDGYSVTVTAPRAAAISADMTLRQIAQCLWPVGKADGVVSVELHVNADHMVRTGRGEKLCTHSVKLATFTAHELEEGK